MLPRTTLPRRLPLLTAACLITALPLYAQRVIPQPVTDSSAQASPLTPVPRAGVDDAAAQASPIGPERTGAGRYIVPRTEIPVALGQAIDSGKLKQGDNVKARLSAPVPMHGGPALPAGTPVVLSVIETVPAGRIMAQGEFSLQVLRIGNVGVYTNTLVFDGKPGHQDLPDSAPALGTDAGLPTGATLTFHVLPQPTAQEAAPPDRGNGGPGAVNGTASGGAPPASQGKSTYTSTGGGTTGSGKTSGQQQPVSPGDTTTNQQTQQMQQPSVAPNQPQVPGRTSPSPSSTPR